MPDPARAHVPTHAVRGLLRGARRAGLDVAPLLTDAGIDPELLDEPGGRLTGAHFCALATRLVREMDDEMIGLAPVRVPPGISEMMCLAVLGCTNLRAALHRAARFYRLALGLAPFRLGEPDTDRQAVFDLAGWRDDEHIAAESVLMLTHRFASWLVGSRLIPRGVELGYSAPAHALEYDLIFGCPVTFGASRTALVLDKLDLALPPVRNERDLGEYLRALPGPILVRPQYTNTTGTQVRRVLMRALPAPLPTLDAVAAVLAISPQNLRRRLRNEGPGTRPARPPHRPRRSRR